MNGDAFVKSDHRMVQVLQPHFSLCLILWRSWSGNRYLVLFQRMCACLKFSVTKHWMWFCPNMVVLYVFYLCWMAVTISLCELRPMIRTLEKTPVFTLWGKYCPFVNFSTMEEKVNPSVQCCLNVSCETLLRWNVICSGGVEPVVNQEFAGNWIEFICCNNCCT